MLALLKNETIFAADDFITEQIHSVHVCILGGLYLILFDFDCCICKRSIILTENFGSTSCIETSIDIFCTPKNEHITLTIVTKKKQSFCKIVSSLGRSVRSVYFKFQVYENFDFRSTSIYFFSLAIHTRFLSQKMIVVFYSVKNGVRMNKSRLLVNLHC